MSFAGFTIVVLYWVTFFGFCVWLMRARRRELCKHGQHEIEMCSCTDGCRESERPCVADRCRACGVLPVPMAKIYQLDDYRRRAHR